MSRPSPEDSDPNVSSDAFPSPRGISKRTLVNLTLAGATVILMGFGGGVWTVAASYFEMVKRVEKLEDWRQEMIRPERVSPAAQANKQAISELKAVVGELQRQADRSDRLSAEVGRTLNDLKAEVSGLRSDIRNLTRQVNGGRDDSWRRPEAASPYPSFMEAWGAARSVSAGEPSPAPD